MIVSLLLVPSALPFAGAGPSSPESAVRLGTGRGASSDPSIATAGGAFDFPPRLAGMGIGPDQSGIGDLGEVVRYDLTVSNDLGVVEDVELSVTSGPVGWRVDLRRGTDGAPVEDTNGDGNRDLPAMAPGEARPLAVLVSIPAAPPVGDTEVTVVSASAHSDPTTRANTTLTTNTVPHIDPVKWADPTTIYREGSPSPLVTETTVHLRIVGSGRALVVRFPQDTVFVVDSSGSMIAPPWSSDPTGLRIDAIRAYIDGMAPTDRAAIVGFGYDPDYGMDSGAWLVNDVGGGVPTHLTQTDPVGKLLLKADAETMRFGNGGTNIEKALQVAHEELLPGYGPGPACIDYARPFPRPGAGGMSGHMWVEILLTDGLPSHPLACTDDEVAAAAANGIRIFTIGLGDFVGEAYLADIAARTGAQYYRARTAGDLLAVYEEIGTVVNRVAGYDSDVNDDLPMVIDVVPAGVNVVPGTFRDPVTGAAKPPAWEQPVAGRTLLEWNVTRLEIGDSWGVEYRVSTPRLGRVPVSQFPEARVTYLRWDSRSVTLSFPPVEVTVLGSPGVVYTIARDPDRGRVTVDGQEHPAPAVFTWTEGEVHTISVPGVDPFGPGERDVFEGWDDGGAAAHAITVGSVDARITAFLIPQVVATIRTSGLAESPGAVVGFRALRAAGSADTRGTWSDWVDAGSSLAIENPVPVSSTERFASLDASTWTVAGPFEAQVDYVRQWRVRVTLLGLEAAHPTGLRGFASGSPIEASVWSGWEDWVDDGRPLGVGAPVLAGPRERFVTGDGTEWTIRSAEPRTVAYVREFRPAVVLPGTDAEHTVLLTIRDRNGAAAVRGVHTAWTDWVEAGGRLEFSTSTNGTPTLYAIDPTGLDVTRAFDGTIRYAPQPPNFKPLISLVYVAVILGVAGGVAHRRPLDLFLNRSEIRRRGRGPVRTPAQEIDDMERKTRNDRGVTFIWIGLPLGAVEGIIGLLSLQTGFLRVPEEGNWLSAGLFLNTILLGLAIALDVIVHKRGYAPAPPVASAAPRTPGGRSR